MVSELEIKSSTKALLEESFLKYFSKAKKETKHIVLDRLFPTERRITSAVTGLQTSLGTYWEKLSIKLAKLNGFTVIDNYMLMKPENIPDELSTLISRVKREREDQGGELISLKDELNQLFDQGELPQVSFNRMTKGKGSDLILAKDGHVYLIDIKTVQINANGGNSFNETLILWTAYYKYQYAINAHDIHAMLVFPYNSANELDDSAWWGDFGGRVSPLTRQDALVGNEYWSFITGNDNALNHIITGLDELANNNDFVELYSQVFNCQNQLELKSFSERVKLNSIQRKLNIELISPLSSRAILEWKHDDNCHFIGRLNRLFNAVSYDCPTCGQQLS